MGIVTVLLFTGVEQWLHSIGQNYPADYGFSWFLRQLSTDFYAIWQTSFFKTIQTASKHIKTSLYKPFKPALVRNLAFHYMSMV